AVAERRGVRPVVVSGVGPCEVRESARHRARRVGEVMHRRAADACRLPEEAVLRQVAGPGRLSAVTGAEPEDSRGRIVRLVLEVRPLALALFEGCARFQEKTVEAECG